MTIGLVHAYVSNRADGGDTNLVQPSNWNEEHVITMGSGALLGRTDADTGVVQEITVTGPLQLTAGALALPERLTAIDDLGEPVGDRLYGWDSSAGGPAFFDVAGGLAISGTTLFSTASNPEYGVISGGQVVWESDYTFRVSAATYYINGALYSSAETTVALDAADGANDRIDLIVLTGLGATKITGTAAAQPSEPDFDPTTQIKLTWVLVDSATSAPPSISNENIYLENTEWTSSVSGSSFTASSTADPYAGTTNIELTSSTSGDYVLLDQGAGVAFANYDTVRLFVKSKAAWTGNTSLRIQWFINGVATGRAITLRDGQYGFSSSNTSTYQQVAIPLVDFTVPLGATVDQLRITARGNGIGCYIDNIILQAISTSGGGNGGANYLTIEQGDARYVLIGSVVSVGAITSSGLTMATSRILGRTTASTGAVEEITVGSGLLLSGGSLAASGLASTSQTAECIAGFIAAPSDKSYTIVLNAPHGGTITNVTTKSASGTCTATWKVNSTALGGTANSVSSSENSQAHSSSNTFVAGDDIVLTVSSNSGCADMSFTIKYTRTLA